MEFYEIIGISGLFLSLLFFLLEIILLQDPGRKLFRCYPILSSYSLKPRFDWNRLNESTVDPLEEKNGYHFRLDQVRKELLFKVSGYKYPIPYIGRIRWPNQDELLISIQLRLGQLCFYAAAVLCLSLGYWLSAAGSAFTERRVVSILIFFLCCIPVLAFYVVKFKRLKVFIVSLDEYFYGQGDPPGSGLL